MKTLQNNIGKVRRYQWLFKIANRIASIPDRVTPPPFRLLRIGSAFWQSRALDAAARLGIADEIGAEGTPVDELARTLEFHPDHLYRLMRLLAAIGVFTEIRKGVFRHSRMSQYLRRDHPHSLRPMILMHNDPIMTAPWMTGLVPSLREGGIPFERAHGMDLFAFMDRHAAFDRLFSEAMRSVTALTGSDYLQDIDWRPFDRLIDVGGSTGDKARAILGMAPHLQALVFDRPQVIARAQTKVEEIPQPTRNRISFLGGDMLKALPPARSNRDVYLFMAIFHGMGDDEARRVLINLRTALGDHRPGILIVDMVAAETGLDPATAAVDMQMLVNTPGRERTLPEWQTLFGSAGFHLVEIVALRSFAQCLVIAANSMS